MGVKRKLEQATDSADDDGEYEVERIQADRVRAGEKEYFIKWKGWGEEYNQWIFATDMNARDLVEKYHAEKSADKKLASKPKATTPAKPEAKKAKISSPAPKPKTSRVKTEVSTTPEKKHATPAPAPLQGVYIPSLQQCVCHTCPIHGILFHSHAAAAPSAVKKSNKK
eukprot:TRINITY_DN9072_c0_g1::TRINITY_DN9072_c0_g1_i1::g.18220::m.18220 TRINITY_DN9072_c0_g1::TRINITY_DN9072_c0_g1_i1::g.18220  ORF type:complete len:168 (-),score=27.71,sp/P05205/HP1_DROME/32.29/8e-08,Chromo/PF00385.19/4.7e-09,Tudor-knot/PF11717.3/0.016,Tudor-knot/PF11717.3/9e+02 TRINITY_DN9072_c0_g1_i1:94-597(-)